MVERLQEDKMKKPNIFIAGISGTGKSTSLRNLDPEKTIILNVEQKQLPFKSAGKFTRQAMIPTIETFEKYFTTALKTENIDVIVIESFTTLCEKIMTKAKKIKVGYDIFGYYNDEVMRFINMSKDTEKYVVFLGIDESEQDETGQTWRYIKVEGRKLRGLIEKEFVMVLYTVPHKNDQGKAEYSFITNGDPLRTAKSPMEMLPEVMPNDLAEVIKLSEEYYK